VVTLRSGQRIWRLAMLVSALLLLGALTTAITSANLPRTGTPGLPAKSNITLDCATGWHSVPFTSSTFLTAVEAVSHDEAWVAGPFGLGPGGPSRWDGDEWVRYDITSGGRSGGAFNGLAASAANDVWIAGWTSDFASGVYYQLVFHWDGSSWRRLDCADCIYGRGPILHAVDVYGPGAAWAVGGGDQRVPNRAYILRCSTAAGCVVEQPLGETESGLNGIAVIGPDDVWAVGWKGPQQQSLILHWNGRAWVEVPGLSIGELNGVSAVAHDDVWVVGRGGILHWDGTAWSQIPSPGGALSVDVAGPNDVWAVGPSVLHWNGSAWSVVYSPGGGLYGVSTVAGNDVWAVGTANQGSPVLRYYDPNRFTDVNPNSTFHPYIHCMACRGIISGYACGAPGEPCGQGDLPYFRPDNQLTRGQLSKIVSNSANFAEDPGAQIFEDVPPGSTFYEWVQRLARRGHISGYPCGGVGEPCVSGKSYFRPNNSATRAQISKIVSNARGYTEPAGTQIFEDVPPSHGFYEWIQRLARHGAMGGYECGGAGEPCGAERRPYFRPNNNATRGQTSKIVSSTFFPECNP